MAYSRNPKFSVAIPVYNRSAYLRQALRSCLLQTTEDFEVIVSDDRSSEDLGAVVAGFNDSRIRHDRSGERLRAAKNHQRAAALARGEYVITLNSDDMLLPDCLATAGDVLDRNEKAGAVYFSCTYLSGAQVEGAHPIPNLNFADSSILANNSWLRDFHGTTPSCVLMRKTAFDQIGGYRTNLRFAYDWDLYRRFLRNGGGVCFLPAVLALYRKHEEQMVERQSLNGLLDILDLWGQDNMYQFQPGDIASLVLKHCAAAWRGGQGWAGVQAVWRHVAERGLADRVRGGIPAALLDKARHRMLPWPQARHPYYREPANAGDAIKQAYWLLARTNDPVFAAS